MQQYLIKRFEDDATLTIIEKIEQRHHDDRRARLKSSIDALKQAEWSPPWSPESLAALRKSAATLC
jgi:hypothetical protein